MTASSGGEGHGGSHGRPLAGVFLPRLIAWEVTRSCMLACKHCRAAARNQAYEGELSTQECRTLLESIAAFSKPIIILTGGEPMLRSDIYEIASYGSSLGLSMVMAPCGMLLNEETVARIINSGIRRISISLDGATAQSHDAFRAVPGAFDAAIRGIEVARQAGLTFQINTTITQHNLAELEQILELAKRLGAAVFNPFLLVPTGRGKELLAEELTAQEYEKTLHWLSEQQSRQEIEIRVTCAPHYQRILRQQGRPLPSRGAKGCMGGQSFAFISHVGKVQICGFLDLECGDVRQAGLDFKKIWDGSEIFRQMRDIDGYHGRCGVCEYRRVCGGCRARAFALTGDWLAEEPFCTHQPRCPAKAGDAARESAQAQAVAAVPTRPQEPTLDAMDRRILSIIQTAFPIDRYPFKRIAQQVDASELEVLRRIRGLVHDGVIRRLGAVFDSAQLGYFSTLVAVRVDPARRDEVAAVISRLDGVTHNYGREGIYNLWFTLSARSKEQIDRTLEELVRTTGAEFHNLPSLALYKIRVDFPMEPEDTAVAPAAPMPAARHEWLPADQSLVRQLQENLPLEASPFDAIARHIGQDVEELLEKIRAWSQAGVIRRFGAVLRHQRVGFVANGMAVFELPPERVDAAGVLLAERREVSHCYARPPLADFPYSLYAMIHGGSEKEVRAVAAELLDRIGASSCQVLFSSVEYKKVSMRYFSDV